MISSRGLQFKLTEIDPAATRPLRQTVLRPHETLGALAAHEPPGTFALGAQVGKVLVAVGLIAPDGEPGGWRIRGMATDPATRGRGAGSAILAGLVEHAERQGARRIWCNARVPARTVYERAGLTAVSEEFEIASIGPHLVMERRLTGRSSRSRASAEMRSPRRPG
jgi:GNAT superfamily N-acetyltransferase